MIKHTMTLMLVGGLFFITACQTTTDQTKSNPNTQKTIIPYQVYQKQYTLGTSVQGTPILAHQIGKGADVTLFIASIHGNEAVGTPLLHELKSYLIQNPKILTGRTVFLIPNANPDGVKKNIRFNVNGVDLNRNYPADNRVDSKRYGNALSEPETQALYKAIHEFQPKRVISIHQPLNCIDYDGPAKLLAKHMAKHADLPIRKLGTRPGSMGAYVGESLGIPIITLEFHRSHSRLPLQQLWDEYHDMLLAAIAYPMPLSAYKQ